MILLELFIDDLRFALRNIRPLFIIALIAFLYLDLVKSHPQNLMGYKPADVLVRNYLLYAVFALLV